jgi:hypothetical protein
LKIKLLKDTPINENISICKGQIFTVRPLLKSTGNLFSGFQQGFQILNDNCQFQGEFLPKENCLEITDEITFTQQEVKVIESVHLAKLDIERAAKERAQELVKGLTETLKQKNKQIEMLDSSVNVLAIVLNHASAAIEKIKDLEKAQ